MQTRVKDAYSRVLLSINAGYHYFDSAQVYLNESEVGHAFKDSFVKGLVKRQDIFVSSKVCLKFNYIIFCFKLLVLRRYTVSSEISIPFEFDYFLPIYSQLWPTHFRAELARSALIQTLNDLGVENLDLYLLHTPFSLKVSF